MLNLCQWSKKNDALNQNKKKQNPKNSNDQLTNVQLINNLKRFNKDHPNNKTVLTINNDRKITISAQLFRLL